MVVIPNSNLKKNPLLLCGIVYEVIRWSHCELKPDLLYFLDIYNNIILLHINVNPIKRCFLMHLNYGVLHRLTFINIVQHFNTFYTTN